MDLFGFKNDLKKNICYLNSILQCLIRIPKLNHIWCTSHSEDCTLFKELKKLSELCRVTDRKVEEVEVEQSQSVIVDYLPKINKKFSVGEYHDAHEVLTDMLNLDSAAITAVKNLFQFECYRKVTCRSCQSVTGTVDTRITLSIHPSKITDSTLSEAIILSELNYTDKLDEYKCENCLKDCKAESNYHVEILPDILIIQINRFDQQGQKICARVYIKDLLNIEECKYHLEAVVSHKGNRCTEGHYVAFVKSTQERWVLCNDSNVNCVPNRYKSNFQEYILFYQKSDNPTTVQDPANTCTGQGAIPDATSVSQNNPSGGFQLYSKPSQSESQVDEAEDKTEAAGATQGVNDQEKYVEEDQVLVKGPSIVEFKSFTEAIAFYMKNNYSGWLDPKKLQTFVVPPVYKMHSSEVPVSNFGLFEEVEAADRHGQVAEETILKTFVDYGYINPQPMFIFHNFDFRDLKDFGEDRLKLTMKMNIIQKETDLIIVHRDIGIILVETKSVRKFSPKRYTNAKDQLDRAIKQLFDNKYFELSAKAKNVVKKVIAFPFLNGKPIESCKFGEGYIDLRQNHLTEIGRWWHAMIQECDKNLCISVYRSLVPKLLCGRGDICVCLNIAETAEQLESQIFYTKLQEKESHKKPHKKNKSHVFHKNLHHKKVKHNKRTVKQESEGEKKVPENLQFTSSISQVKKHLYLTPEQCSVWRNCKQVIYGPYGCGKTILIQCKAATLANSGNKVLVVVPHHLLAAYRNFFKNNVKSTKSELIELVSMGKFYESFDDYILNQSTHVFVDELLWPYTEKPGSSETEFDSSIQHNYGKGNFSQNRKDFILSRYSTIVGGYTARVGLFPPETEDSPETEVTLDSLADSEGIIRPTFVLVKEQNHCPPEVRFLQWLSSLLNDTKRTSCVWIAPHLYIVVNQLLVPAVENVSKYQVDYFVEIFTKLPSSQLTFTMRTVKQIHDFKSENEWKEFCHLCSLKEDTPSGVSAIDTFFNNKKIFQSVFGSYLGHALQGPHVKTIVYPTHCANYDVSEPSQLQNKRDHFHVFCAKVIKSEINELRNKQTVKLQTCNDNDKFKPKYIEHKVKQRDIAIIGDSLDEILNLSYINKLLKDAQFTVCSVNEYLEGKDAVTLCYSSNTASLEWPIVIHIRYHQYHKLKYNKGQHPFVTLQGCPFLAGDHSVITSRCMVQYILIRQHEDHDNHDYTLNTDLGTFSDLCTLLKLEHKPKIINKNIVTSMCFHLDSML